MSARRLLVGTVLLAIAAACTKDGDDGYTALVRYGNSDFRIAAVDARLADPSATPAYVPGLEIALRAVVLAVRDEPIEIEWLDCPSVYYGSGAPNLEFMDQANVDCLGTPQERRLGRGETALYTLRAPRAIGPPRDAGTLEASGPWPDGGHFWDVSNWDLARPTEPPPMTEYDDAIVFVRATQGDQVRYARKSFAGLFDPTALTPSIEGLLVDGAARANDDPDRLVRKPEAALAIRFTALGVLENRMVQWFVSGGRLDRHGLTYYVETGDNPSGLPYAAVENVWHLPESKGRQQLVAIVGGSHGPVPYVRINVEVEP
ncbi:MAG: hypothetical protein JXR83_07120 [Deltaproteobacteria bacterium]|nr:hypothetical protein [Deltaproteobacteria bacterium]